MATLPQVNDTSKSVPPFSAAASAQKSTPMTVAAAAAVTEDECDASANTATTESIHMAALRAAGTTSEELKGLVFSPDLDILPHFPAENADGSVAELQKVSLESRAGLMKLTMSRVGRELQRWGHYDANTGTITDCCDTIDETAATSADSNDNITPATTNDSLTPNCRLTAGCVPILSNGNILLISSSKVAENLFVVPKGGWEQDESLGLSALRETLEEAGVTGILGPPLPALTYETKKAAKRRLAAEGEDGEGNDIDDTTAAEATSSSPVAAATTKSKTPLNVIHTHNNLTVFPLYVQEIYDEWPEPHRIRRSVTMEEAKVLVAHRPEFLHMVTAVADRNWHHQCLTHPPPST